MMKLIYVSTGPNVKEAEKACKLISMMGYIPFSPVLFFKQIGGTESEVYTEAAKSSVFRRCDEVWVYGKDITDDLRKDIELAYSLAIPVQHMESE